MNELRGVADALHRRREKRTAALARHRRPSGMVMAAIMNPKTVRVVDDTAPQGARAELRPFLGVAFPDRAEKFPDTSDPIP
jgi:hypothetical protein